jgi:hypothetical protein
MDLEIAQHVILLRMKDMLMKKMGYASCAATIQDVSSVVEQEFAQNVSLRKY